MTGEIYTDESEEKSLTPLALTLDPGAAQVVLPGAELRWSDPVRELLTQVRKQTAEARRISKISLPYSSLRQVFEVHLPGASRIRRDLAMCYRKPFAHVDCSEKGVANILGVVQQVARTWVDGALTRWARESTAQLAALGNIFENGDGVDVRSTNIQVVPWHEGPTGVAKPPDGRSFRALADWAARLLAGHELLPDTGPWRRVVSAGGDEAEGVLLSPPRDAWDGGPRFAFFLKLKVITVPFQPQPLLHLTLGKRRFLSSLPKGWTRQRRISGHIWSANHLDRAFTFEIHRSKSLWEVDEVLEACIDALGLNAHAWDPEAIVGGRASNDAAQVHLLYSNSLRGAPVPSVLSGVPERDKLDLLNTVAGILGPQGCQPMPAPHPVAGVRRGPSPRSRKVLPETLLWSVAENAQAPPDEVMGAEEVKRRLHDVVGIDLREFADVDDDPAEWKLEPSVLDALVKEGGEALRRHRPEGVSVVILADPAVPKQHQILTQECAKALLGDDVSIYPMPPDVSGHRDTLPGAKERSKTRLDLRVKAWRRTAEGVAKLGPSAACIVLSPKWFDDRRHDDQVNKPAGRHALAVHGRASVQYLLPPEGNRGQSTINLRDFIFRLQAALADVLFAHAGRIDNLEKTVAATFPTNPPKTVVGFTVIRRNAGSGFRFARGSRFVAAIRVDVDSGLAFLRFGTANAHGALQITEWTPFFEGLTQVAKTTPISLGAKRPDQRRNYEKFVEQTMTDLLERDSNPVVMIDSSTSAEYWGWLRDQDLNPRNIKIGAHEHMQDEWAGVRLVRVRKNNSPGLPTQVIHTLTNDTGTCEVQTPTATAGLYRLPGSNNGAHVYLSAAGLPSTFKEKKGVSCYRPMPLLERVREDRKAMKDEAGRPLVQIQHREPASRKRWMLPDPIEFTVVLTPEGEVADATAGFVHELRALLGHFNEQTKLPAPLFFERALREYTTAFGIEEVED